MLLDASLVTVIAKGSHGPLVTMLRKLFQCVREGPSPTGSGRALGHATETVVRAFCARNGLSTGIVLVGNRAWKIVATKWDSPR